MGGTKQWKRIVAVDIIVNIGSSLQADPTERCRRQAKRAERSNKIRLRSGRLDECMLKNFLSEMAGSSMLSDSQSSSAVEPELVSPVHEVPFQSVTGGKHVAQVVSCLGRCRSSNTLSPAKSTHSSGPSNHSLEPSDSLNLPNERFHSSGGSIRRRSLDSLRAALYQTRRSCRC